MGLSKTVRFSEMSGLTRSTSFPSIYCAHSLCLILIIKMYVCIDIAHLFNDWVITHETHKFDINHDFLLICVFMWDIQILDYITFI